MERDRPDDVDRVLDLLECERLNEFKHTARSRAEARGHAGACGCRTPKRSCGRSRRTPRSAPTSATSRSSSTRPTTSGCGTRSRARSPRSRASRNASSPRRCASCRPSSPTTRPSTSTTTSAASRCRRRATRARCSTSAARWPSSRSTGRGRSGSSRLIDGLEGGRAALLQKIHHTITDGVGGLKLSLALRRLRARTRPVADEPERRRTRGRARTAARPARCAARRGRRRDASATSTRCAGSLGGTAGVLVRPTQLPGRADRLCARRRDRVRRQGFVADRARLRRDARPLAAPPLRDATRSRCPALKAAANASGGSVNDVYVTGSRGALGRYHERLGSDGATTLRMAMPISTRGRGDDAANRSCRRESLVPIQPATTRARCSARCATACRRAKQRDRRSARPTDSPVGDRSCRPRSSSRSRATRPAPSTSRRRTCAAARCRSTSPGARIDASYPFGPRTGTALNATMLGYCDDLHLGFNIDPAAITDVDGLMIDIAAVVRRPARLTLARPSAAGVRAGARRPRRATRRTSGSRQRRWRQSVAVVDDVEVQRRRLVGEIDEVARRGDAARRRRAGRRARRPRARGSGTPGTPTRSPARDRR